MIDINAVMFSPLHILCGAFLGILASWLAAAPVFETQELFPSSPDNKPNFRIPSLITAPNGDLLAIVERRNTGIGDIGDFDIVMRRSSDLGRTWGPIEVIFDDGISTSTDLTPLVAEVPDGQGGIIQRIFLFFLKNKKKFSYIYSDDSAHTWVFNGTNENTDLPEGTPMPFIIHDQVTRNAPDAWDYYDEDTPNDALDQPVTEESQVTEWNRNWSQRYGIGPGNGAVQLKYNPDKSLNGRILVPARHRATFDGKAYTYAHIFYSDDFGQTWTLTENTETARNGNEGQLVELLDGTLIHNIRNQNPEDIPDNSNRYISYSYDGGSTWTPVVRDDRLISTTVHASTELYVNPTDSADPNNGTILFANPCTQHREENHPYGRYRVSVRYSTDNATTWSEAKLIYPHPSSYTDLTILPDGTVGMIYERGDPGDNAYWSSLQFARFNMEWLKSEDTKVTSIPLRLANIFSEGMVLQHGKPINIWGYSSAGDQITVSLLGQTSSTIADENGRWIATLPALPVTGTPQTLTVSGPVNTLYVGNILIGDVWVASGQSNMNWRVRQLGNATEEIHAARHPLIREFKVTEQSTSIRYTPDDNLTGTWTRSSPSDLTTGGFSGTAFYFARELMKRNPDVPIGIINASVGGTVIEAWSTYDTALNPSFNYINNHYESTSAARDYPASLYNSMISPLTIDNGFNAAYPIAGFIWYQGEHNASATYTDREQLLYQYSMLFPALIKSWREKFQAPSAPFYFVQLANYSKANGKWVSFRDVQLQALSLPNTGVAITIDIGEDENIHPANKQDVGLRLALNAWHSYYKHSEVEYSGPIPSNIIADEDRLIITFTHDTGIHLDDSKIRPETAAFEVAGDDLCYQAATATLNGSRIEISSPLVSSPRHVRYAWSDSPSVPLYNAAKLPAPPFIASATNVSNLMLSSQDDMLVYALTNDYTFDSDNTPGNGNLSAYRPKITNSPNGDILISFVPLRLGYTYEVQYSTDLINWTSIKSIKGSLYPSPEKISIPANGLFEKKFLRLKITPDQ